MYDNKFGAAVAAKGIWMKLLGSCVITTEEKFINNIENGLNLQNL